MNYSVLRLWAFEIQDYIFGQQGGALLAEQLQTKLLAQIPIAPPEPDLLNPHTLPSVYAPESTNGKLFNKLAEHIIHTNTRNGPYTTTRFHL
ncbi:hypothetical protein PV433_07895 [Paenibacillus sp. GYB004]|uniref:hypothetical protein n=1 Tax=Paenibacillus sp. GYB004 TaxID=2994393 RepID=UPI002F9638D1